MKLRNAHKTSSAGFLAMAFNQMMTPPKRISVKSLTPSTRRRNMESDIINILTELLQYYGPEHGVTNTSMVGTDCSVAFDFSGKSFLISSNDINLIDELVN